MIPSTFIGKLITFPAMMFGVLVSLSVVMVYLLLFETRLSHRCFILVSRDRSSSRYPPSLSVAISRLCGRPCGSNGMTVAVHRATMMGYSISVRFLYFIIPLSPPSHRISIPGNERTRQSFDGRRSLVSEAIGRRSSGGYSALDPDDQELLADQLQDLMIVTQQNQVAINRILQLLEGKGAGPELLNGAVGGAGSSKTSSRRVSRALSFDQQVEGGEEEKKEEEEAGKLGKVA